MRGCPLQPPSEGEAPGAAAFSPGRCLLFFSLGGRWREADPAPWLSLPPASRAVLGGELGVPRWLGCSVASVTSGGCLPSGPPSLIFQWGGGLAPPPLGLMGPPWEGGDGLVGGCDEHCCVSRGRGLSPEFRGSLLPSVGAGVREGAGQIGERTLLAPPGMSVTPVCVFGGWGGVHWGWGWSTGAGGCWLAIDGFREVGSRDPECSLGPAVHTSASRAASRERPPWGRVGGLRAAEACFVPHSAAPPHPIPGQRYLCFQAVSFCRESLRALPG